MARPLRTPEKELRPDLAQYRRKVDLAWQRTTAGQSIAEHGPEVQRSATEHDTNCLNAKREEKRMPGTHELDTRSKLMKAHAPPRFAVKRIETGVSYRERCSRLVLRSALSIRRLGAQQKKKRHVRNAVVAIRTHALFFFIRVAKPTFHCGREHAFGETGVSTYTNLPSGRQSLNGSQRDNCSTADNTSPGT